MRFQRLRLGETDSRVLPCNSTILTLEGAPVARSTDPSNPHSQTQADTQAQRDRAARLLREAESLRENLRRRKRQARARAASGDGADDTASRTDPAPPEPD